LKGPKAIFRPRLRMSKERPKTSETEEPSSLSTAEAQVMDINLCKDQTHSVKESREIRQNTERVALSP